MPSTELDWRLGGPLHLEKVGSSSYPEKNLPTPGVMHRKVSRIIFIDYCRVTQGLFTTDLVILNFGQAIWGHQISTPLSKLLHHANVWTLSQDRHYMQRPLKTASLMASGIELITPQKLP
ncbi:hypothetical protein TNCV_2494941 [Trichonephila clavipes]|nr:hypothetical protein TNCV_2494941 [Trichonephila clavipes]